MTSSAVVSQRFLSHNVDIESHTCECLGRISATILLALQILNPQSVCWIPENFVESIISTINNMLVTRSVFTISCRFRLKRASGVTSIFKNIIDKLKNVAFEKIK